MSFTNMKLNTLSLRTLPAIYVCMYVLPNEPMLQLSVMKIPLEQIQSKIEGLSINNSCIVSWWMISCDWNTGSLSTLVDLFTEGYLIDVLISHTNDTCLTLWHSETKHNTILVYTCDKDVIFFCLQNTGFKRYLNYNSTNKIFPSKRWYLLAPELDL